MIPVMPRRPYYYPDDYVTVVNGGHAEYMTPMGLRPCDITGPPYYRSAPISMSSVHSITRMQIDNPRSLNHTRIVVVGGGDLGVTSLRELVYNKTAKFTNLTLVDPDGLGDGHVKHSFLSWSTDYSHDELEALGLTAKVSTVRAKLIKIDRESKVRLF